MSSASKKAKRDQGIASYFLKAQKGPVESSGDATSVSLSPTAEHVNKPSVIATHTKCSTSASAGPSNSEISLATTVPEEAHKPGKNYVFPVTQIGKAKRCCRYEWFDTWQWLHYDMSSDAVFCIVCIKAASKNLIHTTARQECSSFIKGGFRNWKKATEKFRDHEKSDLHNEATLKLSNTLKTPINASLSKQVVEDQKSARVAMGVIWSSIKYLARQGFPLLGDQHDDGAFYQLVKERANDVPDVARWLKRRDKWMSNTIQNEIIEMIAHDIQRQIVSDAKKSHFFGITADGTTDLAGKEQLATTIQYVTNDLCVESRFLGFYNAPDSSGETLYSVICDVLLRLGLPLEDLQGFCFDGASNMSGRVKGVQARLKETCPNALYVHCANHSLDLALQEVSSEVMLVANSLQFVKDAANVIRESSKRKELYYNLFGEADVVMDLIALCPTRWCIRSSAVSRVLSVYSTLLKTLESLVADKNVRATVRAKISGLRKMASSAETYFGLLLCGEIFTPCEDIAKTLQGKGVTASTAIKAAEALLKLLTAKRTDSKFEELIKKCDETSALLDLSLPVSHRKRTVPARLRYTDTADDELADTPVSYTLTWKRKYFEAIDLVTAEITRRFLQKDLEVAAMRENVLLAAVDPKFEHTQQELKDLKLPASFDLNRLMRHLHCLRDLQMKGIENARDLAKSLSRTPEVKKLIAEAEKLLVLVLSLPVSVAESERSFSCLRRLKTWLRSQMTQKRLSQLALIHVHKDVLDGMDFKHLIRDFISKTPERRSVFGV